MERTTIMLPHDLKLQVAQHARKKGISMGELIRDAITSALFHNKDNSRDDDPLFSDNELFCGPAPTDISANHDKYLYDKNNDFS